MRAELARNDLLEFAQLVYPGFECPPHIQLIGNLLEDLAYGRIRRLAVSVPVRHGKSVLCSQCFVAWFLGRYPALSVILACHSESLGVMLSRGAKYLVEDDRWP